MNLKVNLLYFILFLNVSFLVTAGNQELETDQNTARNLYFKGISLARNSFYYEAIDSFKIALKIQEKITGKNSYAAGVIHNALGINYKNVGNLNKSIEHYLQAETCYLNDGDLKGPAVARLYGNIGNVYKIKLNFETALDYLQRAIYTYKSMHEASMEDIAEIHYNIAEVYYKQNKYQKVIEIADEYLPSAYNDTRLYFLSLKAASLKELKKHNEANEAYQKVIIYAQEYFSDGDLNIVFEYLNYANFLISIDEFKESLNIIEQINQIITQKNIHYGILYSSFQKVLGAYYEYVKVESSEIKKFQAQKSQNLEKAIKYYQLAYKALEINENEEISIENTLSVTQSLDILKLIADAYAQLFTVNFNSPLTYKKQSIHEALKYYELTADMIQTARKSMFSDEDRILLSELEEATFIKMVQTAYKAYELENDARVVNFAFSSAERMKASSVFDKLTDQFARENSLIPDSLTELELTLNYSITNLNEKLFNLRRYENRDEKEITRTDSLLFNLKKQRDELNQYLEKNFGDYYEMKYSNSMIEVEDVQRKLKRNEVLIEYVLNETDTIPEVYAFVLSPTLAGFYKLNADTSFIPSLENTFRFVSNPAYLFTRNDHSKDFCISANFLYKILLQPFEEIIKNKKIIIVPDGMLSYLPFEALLTELPDTSEMIQFNSLQYLIRNHTINYSYSTNLLYNTTKQKKKAKNRLLAFAPQYNSDTIFFNNEKLVLIPLPGVQREVDLIAGEVKARLFKGEEATEQNFREQSKNYDILHLAMHAFINDSIPAYSRFAFTQNQESTANTDGWLNTADIYNLDLNARLTVLSACNTGRGKLRKGEGLMSLARGFLYAGCPSIIMSLWEVEDNAGTEIMRTFYQVLKKGRSTDDALRQAKINYLEQANPRLAHPHYWLGYVSIGNTDPLFKSYDFYFFGLVILALAGIIADQIIHFRKSGKRRYRRK